MTKTIACDIIDLYQYVICYDDDYTFTIVSDTIAGIAKGIVEREQLVSTEDARTYLESGKFLLVPEENNEFSLFDMENHNLSIPLGLTLEEQFYDCYFDGVPKSVDIEKFNNIVADICATLASDDEHIRGSKASAILAMALFESPLVQEEMAKKKEEQDMKDDCEAYTAVELIKQLIES